ncbi:MAG TPA: universal stress protein [Mycobacteriales bacterium]
MTGRIVVGIDGSAPSLLAVRWAAIEAADRGAGLCLCCVAVEDLHGQPMLWTGPQVVRREATDVAGQAEAEAEMTRPEVEVSVRIVVGDAATELAAAGVGADLLVVGSRGLGGFAGLLLGSVGERVTRHPATDVVVVRGDPADWTGPVLVGIDDAPETSAAVEFAVATAARRAVPLVVLTAVPGVWPGPPPAAGVEQSVHPGGLAGLVADIQDDALEPALRNRPYVQVERRIASHAAARALIDASHGCGLVVVGAGRGPLGSVAGHVSRHATCPVAIVPGPADHR